MELSVKRLKEIIEELDEDVILATLRIGNDDFGTFKNAKRLLLLEREGKKYLTINAMGSHFTGEGFQKGLSIVKYWDK